MVGQLGRAASWLARLLLEVDARKVYASRCTCGWVGRPWVDPLTAELEGLDHEVKAEA